MHRVTSAVLIFVLVLKHCHSYLVGTNALMLISSSTCTASFNKSYLRTVQILINIETTRVMSWLRGGSCIIGDGVGQAM